MSKPSFAADPNNSKCVTPKRSHSLVMLGISRTRAMCIAELSDTFRHFKIPFSTQAKRSCGKGRAMRCVSALRWKSASMRVMAALSQESVGEVFAAVVLLWLGLFVGWNLALPNLRSDHG